MATFLKGTRVLVAFINDKGKAVQRIGLLTANVDSTVDRGRADIMTFQNPPADQNAPTACGIIVSATRAADTANNPDKASGVYNFPEWSDIAGVYTAPA